MVGFSVTCLKTYPEPHNEGVFCDVFEDLPGTPCWVFCDVSGSYWDINFFNKKRWVLQYLISIKVQRQIHMLHGIPNLYFKRFFKLIHHLEDPQGAETKAQRRFRQKSSLFLKRIIPVTWQKKRDREFL